MHAEASQHRYAVYFAPPKGSALDRFGAAWLGRDAFTGAMLPLDRIQGIASGELSDIILAAALYGFHGTLKPPFYLAPGISPDDLLAALGSFALKQQPFVLPRLVLSPMGRFLALVPEGACPQVETLAAACVRHFDWFRKKPSAAELARRRERGLTARQEAYLTRWGYPYVMQEFRFHLTLTGPVTDPCVSQRLTRELRRRLEGLDLSAVPVDAISLFVQPGSGSPFVFHSRYEFGKP